MKKEFLLAILALAGTGALGAQTILSEDFETGNTGTQLTPVAAGPGWTVINGYSGTNPSYNWHNYYANADSDAGATISGNGCAAVDAPYVYGDGDGTGPREEILLSPEITLDGTCELQFTFRVSPVNSYANSKYDIQVRVVENGNIAGAETIFSIQNDKMLRDAGISVFPIPNWNPYTAKVDLSDFAGESVKLAFVYKMMGETANILLLDDITVKKAAPITGPIARIDMERYDFGEMYVGEKRYSEVITLTNVGKDVLTITGLDLPEGVALNLNPADVALERYRTATFQLVYTASLASAGSGTATIHTNGGDVAINFSATKTFVPAGMTLETFEGYFPPAGWQTNGWSGTSQAIEGDQSAVGGGDWNNCTLRSPRLDLSDGGSVTFTYFNLFNDFEEVPQYDIELQVSYDGGDNWQTKWISDYINGLDQLLTETVDLGLGSDNSYIRWFYPAIESDDEGAFPHSTFYLDRVLLPNVYGADGVPGNVRLLSPENGAQNVYPQGVVLTWAPAQFADGYKLYVGTNSEVNDLVDGLDLRTALTYTLPVLEYETTYRWKVVPYNSKGSNNGSAWRFTTQRDASVVDFPYEENFLSDELPTGWHSTPGNDSYGRQWYINSIYKYKNDGNTYGAATSFWLNAGVENSLETPAFILPEDKPMQISFIWGDEHPSDLVVDPTGSVRKQNAEPNNGISETFFEVLDGGEWHTLSTLSETKYGDKKNWINERIDLTPYKGKKVQFRWRHASYSNQDDGASLTHITLDENKSLAGCFNKSGWEFGKVNYGKNRTADGNLTLINLSTDPMKVISSSFTTPNFSSSIAVGDVVNPGEVKPFEITFNALSQPGEVADTYTVTFEGGLELTMPVSGTALPSDVRYYSFEPTTGDYIWDQDFSMIDVDRQPCYHFSTYWINYSADSMRCAFSLENDTDMYGMMKPVSGNHCLVASSGDSTNGDNWIISPKFLISEGATFDFYGRNWETLNSVMPDPKHHVQVLVSTASNTDTNAFEVAMRDTEMPFLGEGQWNHYTVDLSQWAGQEVYVAMRHFTVSPSNLAFFDDFTFTGIAAGSSVEALDADDTQVTVYTVSGLKVAEGEAAATLRQLPKGLYIVKQGDKVRRILK